MMDCKKALVDDGHRREGLALLRVKGLASAAKKGERATKEGLIGTYVHTGGKLGVMVEVNPQDGLRQVRERVRASSARCSPCRSPRARAWNT